MKKIVKNICLFSIMLCLSLMFIDNVQAKLCVSYEANECPEYDTEGNKCTPDYGNSAKECKYAADSEQPCYVFNSPRYWTDGNPDMSKCPTDRCTTVTSSEDQGLAGYCLPRIGEGEPYTCEDFGAYTNLYENKDICTTDTWGNPCSGGSNPGSENTLCYTYEKIYSHENTKFCKDYTSETECKNLPSNKDEYGNVCTWDTTTSECKILENQVQKNLDATSSQIIGMDLESYKKLLNIIINNNPVSNEKTPFKCSDVKYLTSAWLFIRIAAPFIVVLFGSLDFFKSMVAGDEKKMRESRGKFIKRLIAFGLLILLPFIVQFVFQIMGTYGSDNVCLVKCIATNDTSEKGCD